MEYRINGFKQIEAFYTWVFNNADKNIRPHHISLYMFMLTQNNKKGWVEWITLPYDDAMQGACIASRSTYYKTLHDLKEWGLIGYEAGVNAQKAPIISIKQLSINGLVPIPQGEPLDVPQDIPQGTPLGEPLPIHYYITNNYKQETDNSKGESIESLSERFDSFTPTSEGEEKHKMVKSAVELYRLFCDHLGKAPFKKIPALEWISKFQQIPNDEYEKIPHIFSIGARARTFTFLQIQSIDDLINKWVKFRSEAKVAYEEKIKKNIG